MEDLNVVTIVGRLTADPEMRATTSGTSIASLRLAFTSSRKNSSTGEWEDESNYIGVTVFGNHGEAIARYASKGTKVAVKGRLRYREWETDNGKRSVIEVVADRVYLLDSRNSSERPQSQPDYEPAADF